MQSAEAQKDAPKVEPVFDEDDVPAGKLDDAEIARLVSLSSQATYHRTDNIPVKPKESFEPRTLVTIAMEAQRRREVELQASVTQKTSSTDGTDLVGASLIEGSGMEDAADHALMANDPTEAMQAETTESTISDSAAMAEAKGDTTSQQIDEAPADEDTESNEPELSEAEIAAAAMAEELQAEFERGLAEGFGKGEEVGHKAGHDKGYEVGCAAGQAEATAQLETAIQGFEKATLALTNSAVLDLDALTASIHDAILSLASERAGLAIAEMPESFACRIESILATIKRGTDHPQITLNPNDLLALKPIISTREKLQKCVLSADETLAPGDVRLVIDGIGVEDELYRRVSRKAAVQPGDATASNAQPTETTNLSFGADAPTTDAAIPEAAAIPTDITEPEEATLVKASTTSDETPSEISTASKNADEGGFSIGLKSKISTEETSACAADSANETGADQ